MMVALSNRNSFIMYEKGTNRVPIAKLLAIGIKTKKEDINYFLPHDISEETEIIMKLP